MRERIEQLRAAWTPNINPWDELADILEEMEAAGENEAAARVELERRIVALENAMLARETKPAVQSPASQQAPPQGSAGSQEQ